MSEPVTSALQPMAFGDIFDVLFKLLGKTIRRNFALVFMLFLLPALVFIAGIHFFASSLADLFQYQSSHPEGPQAGELASYLMPMSGALVGYLALALGITASISAVTVVACGEMNGETIRWEDALQIVFPKRFLRVCGQIILQAVCLIGLFCVPVLFFVLIKISAWFAVPGVVGFLVVICFLVKLTIDWAFTTPVIVWEEAGALNSFGRSSELVRGHWWRVFGIYLLLHLIVQFAISIVSAPINLIALWGFYSKYFHMMDSLKKGVPQPQMTAGMIRSFGFGFGIVMCFGQLLSSMVQPLITTVLYFDLRARRREFSQSTLPEPPLPVIGEPA